MIHIVQKQNNDTAFQLEVTSDQVPNVGDIIQDGDNRFIITGRKWITEKKSDAQGQKLTKELRTNQSPVLMVDTIYGEKNGKKE